ncbi:MAG: hypothetical protein ACXW3Z_03125 [Limisphaerales bacterium]
MWHTNARRQPAKYGTTGISFSTIRCAPVNVAKVNSENPNPEATHSDIQEILRKRRETLNRVKADLQRVDKLQADFCQPKQKSPNPPNLGK